MPQEKDPTTSALYGGAIGGSLGAAAGYANHRVSESIYDALTRIARETAGPEKLDVTLVPTGDGSYTVKPPLIQIKKPSFAKNMMSPTILGMLLGAAAGHRSAVVANEKRSAVDEQLADTSTEAPAGAPAKRRGGHAPSMASLMLQGAAAGGIAGLLLSLATMKRPTIGWAKYASEKVKGTKEPKKSEEPSALRTAAHGALAAGAGGVLGTVAAGAGDYLRARNDHRFIESQLAGTGTHVEPLPIFPRWMVDKKRTNLKLITQLAAAGALLGGFAPGLLSPSHIGGVSALSGFVDRDS